MTRALIRSGLAGGVALIIYAIISAAVNAGSAGSIAIGAVLLGLFTFVIARVINIIIASIVARRS